MIFYGLELFVFGVEVSDFVLIGDDVIFLVLILLILFQFGNGLLDGFDEVYVSKFRIKYLCYVYCKLRFYFFNNFII